ncbi:O-antigen ligase family protein [Prosthecomicrobium sp. N25]|uniref:O-antigen ligase family protein n=1 Tax=Prosthecomicrobium sp. N25 TaxID=3129254 RepID=UPI00307767C0
MVYGTADRSLPAGRSRGLTLANVEFALVQLAVLFAPFQAFRPPEILLTLSDVLFMAVLVLRVLAGTLPLRPLGPGMAVWVLGCAMLIGGITMSSVLRGDPFRGLIVGIQYGFAYLVLPFALLARPYDQMVKLVRMGVWSMVAICGVGLFMYFTGVEFGDATTPQLDAVSGSGRLTSLVGDANTLSGMIGLTLPALAYSVGKKSLPRWFGAVLILFFLYSVILTSSNTGLLVFMTALVILAIGRLEIATFVKTAFAGLLVVGLLVQFAEFILPGVFLRRVGPALSSGDLTQAGTFQGRWELMVEAFRMLPDNLLVGMGADVFRTVSEHKAPVHNLYLLLGVEGGLVTICGWMVILLGGLVAALGAGRRPDRGLDFLVVFSTTGVFAVLAATFPHMYARFLIVPLLLAISPSVALRSAVPTARRHASP